MNKALIIVGALGVTGLVLYIASKQTTTTVKTTTTTTKTTSPVSGAGGLLSGLKNLFGGSNNTTSSGSSTTTPFDPTNPGSDFFDTSTGDNSGEDDNLDDFNDNESVA